LIKGFAVNLHREVDRWMFQNCPKGFKAFISEPIKSVVRLL